MNECSLWICHDTNDNYVSAHMTTDDVMTDAKLSSLTHIVFSDCDEDILYNVSYDDFVKFMKENGEKIT